MFFLVNTVLGQVSVIANDRFFRKTSSNSMEKSAWFYCISVVYVVLKHFCVNLFDSF